MEEVLTRTYQCKCKSTKCIIVISQWNGIAPHRCPYSLDYYKHDSSKWVVIKETTK